MATDVTKQNLAALASRYQKPAPAADAASPTTNNGEQGGIRNWRQRVVATRYTPGQYSKGAQTPADDKKNNNENKNKKNKVEELGYDDFSLDDDENTNSNSSSSSEEEEEEVEEDDVVVKDVPQPPIVITKPAKPEETNGKETPAPTTNKPERVPSLHMGFTAAKEVKKEIVTSPATDDRDKLVQQLRDEINKLKHENEEYKKMMTKFSGELQGAVSKLNDAIKELDHKENQEQTHDLMMKKMEQKLDEQLTRMEVKSMRMFQQYYETDLLRRAESGNNSKGVNTFLYVQFGLWVLIIVSLILWLSARRADYD
jgi:hypothetical protein